MGKKLYKNICMCIVIFIVLLALYNVLLKEGFQQKKYSLAFYTCFYGENNNVAFKIPEVPSDIYDCYYYTNNIDLLKEIYKTKWKGIYDNKPVSTNINTSTMQGKYVKVMPHNVNPLKNYDYTCYLDSKLDKVSESFILQKIEDAFIKKSYALLLREHVFIKDANIWNEYNESMKQERYKKESDKIKFYINSQVEEGWVEQIDTHCQCGLLLRNMKHPIVLDINNSWYSDIQKCGIQDQISFFFVKQKFNEYILPFSENPFTSL